MRLALALCLVPALSFARTIRVTDASGAPVPTATARWEGGSADAGDGGVLELPDGAAACVTAPGFVPAAAPDAAGPLALRRGHAITGSIATPARTPVPGVVVRVDGDAAPCARAATSDATGAFVLHGLGEGIARLDVSAPEGWLVSPSHVRVAVAGPRRLDLVAHEALRVTLAVTGADGKALPGARVRILADWSRFPLAPPLEASAEDAIDDLDATSDAEGRVVLPPLPRRSGWRIAVTHPDHAPSSATLDLTTGAAPSPVVRLLRGGTITLRTVDDSGAPFARPVARLVTRAADADLVEPAPGDAAGRLALAHLPAGTYALELRAKGARPRLVRGIAVKDGAVTELGDVALDPGVTLSGTVTGDGAPIEGATVTIDTYAEGAKLRLDAKTDAEGRFSVDGLDPDALATVRAEAKGFVAAKTEDVRPGPEAVRMDLKAAASLRVDVLDESGGPARDATVALRRGGYPMRHEPVRDGTTFVLEGLEPEPADVMATAPGMVPAIQRDVSLVGGERADVRLTLRAGRTITGVVRHATTHAPIGGARLRVQGTGQSALSQGDGTFSIAGLDGPFTLRADEDHHVPATLEAVDPDALPAEGLVVPMSSGGSLAGLVLGPDRAPLPGASVEAAGRSATTDAAGRYRLDGLKPGSVEVTKRNRAETFEGFESATVTVAAGQVTRHDFGAGVRITGTITRGGQPARQAQVALMRVMLEEDMRRSGAPGMIPMSIATTDDDGAFAITDAMPGPSALNVRWQGRRIVREVLVPAEGEARFDVELPDSVLSGRVVDASGGPVAQAHLSLTPRNQPEGRMQFTLGMMAGTEEASLSTEPGTDARSGLDGSFALLADGDGPHVLGAWAEGYEMHREDVDVQGSRAGMLLTLTSKDAGSTRFRVRLVDASTGGEVAGTIIVQSKGSSNVMGGSSVAKGTFAGDEPVTITAWAAGHAVTVLRDLKPEEGRLEIDVPMSPGGALKLHVAPGALAAGGFGGLVGDMSLKLSSGLDLAEPGSNARMNILGQLASEGEPGEWTLRDLTPGPTTVRVGAVERTVTIEAGETAELDLR